MAKREYVSMRGKVVDMELLKKMNELVPAVGNAKVNARGDELGPGGKIIRKREDIVKEYYKNNPNQVLKDSAHKTKVTESNVTESNVINTATSSPMADLSAHEKELIEPDDWVEDDTGNFVKKEKSSKKPKAE